MSVESAFTAISVSGAIWFIALASELTLTTPSAAALAVMTVGLLGIGFTPGSE